MLVLFTSQLNHVFGNRFDIYFLNTCRLDTTDYEHGGEMATVIRLEGPPAQSQNSVLFVNTLTITISTSQFALSVAHRDRKTKMEGSSSCHPASNGGVRGLCGGISFLGQGFGLCTRPSTSSIKSGSSHINPPARYQTLLQYHDDDNTKEEGGDESTQVRPARLGSPSGTGEI